MRLSLTKTAVDESGDRLLAREARWLRELEAVPELEGQIPRLLEECGFELEACYGWFDRSPHGDGEDMIFVARRS